MEMLAALPIIQGGALAVLTLFSAACLFGLLRGTLITATQHNRELAALSSIAEMERAEKAMWRDTALTSSSQTSQMVEGQETMIQLLRGLIDEKDSP